MTAYALSFGAFERVLRLKQLLERASSFREGVVESLQTR